MTWHAKALQTCYVTAPGAGAIGEREDEAAFPYGTAVLVLPRCARHAWRRRRRALVICFGDSITDGTGSTLNGDDRWPDVLGAAAARGGHDDVVVDAGIGGNQVAGPAEYGPTSRSRAAPRRCSGSSAT